MPYPACLQISKTYTHYAATTLFFFFGFKTLYDTFFGEEVRGPAAVCGSHTTRSRRLSSVHVLPEFACCGAAVFMSCLRNVHVTHCLQPLLQQCALACHSLLDLTFPSTQLALQASFNVDCNLLLWHVVSALPSRYNTPSRPLALFGASVTFCPYVTSCHLVLYYLCAGW
jgi:hypothetical protein